MKFNSFIHSGYFYGAFLWPLATSQRRNPHSTDTVPEFHAKAPQATVGKGLAQGPYVTARAGVEPTTLRTTGDDSTNEPPRPTSCIGLLLLSLHVRFWEPF